MSVRFERKHALEISDLVDAYIRDMKLAAGLNTQRVFEAWDKCSGASAYTLDRFYRDGVLTVTMNSSMVRDRMRFDLELIIKKMNDYLLEDELFVKDDPKVGLVKTIKLK